MCGLLVSLPSGRAPKYVITAVAKPCFDRTSEVPEVDEKCRAGRR